MTTQNTSRQPLRIAVLAAMALGLQLQTGCTVYVQQQPDQPQAVAETPAPPPAPEVTPQPYEPPPAPVVTVYQDNLSPYGSWVNVDGYGQCWSPNGRPDGWQPYTVGHWAYSDYGWTWVAEEDEAQWGDVTYHYGRWYRDSSYGWVWIPGVTWAPAWVAWREGGGYCGWAPLPPQAGFGPEVSVAEVDRYVPPQQYVYCNERDVNNTRVDQHIVHNDVTIINQTTNITNITYVNNTVINRGVSITNVQRATGRPVEKVEIAQASTASEAHDLAAAGKPVRYSPPVVQQAETQRAEKARTAKATARAKPQVNQPGMNAPPSAPQETNDHTTPKPVTSTPEPGGTRHRDEDNSTGGKPTATPNQPSPDQSTDKARRDQDDAVAKARQDQDAAAAAKAKAQQDADTQAQKAKQDADAQAQKAQAAAAEKAKAEQDAAADAKAKEDQAAAAIKAKERQAAAAAKAKEQQAAAAAKAKLQQQQQQQPPQKSQ